MYVLDRFWAGAVILAGRIDFRVLYETLGPPRAEGWTRAEILGTGLVPALADALFGQDAVRSEQPFLTLADERYPERLRVLANPPPVLFYAGDLALLERPSVAIVGSRSSTATGLTLARRFAQVASAAGAAVVSGLARGIDTAAHEASIPRTIAVLGEGLATRLVGTRGALQERMSNGEGVVLSEFLPAWGGSRWTFPRRNRIIAGLGDVTLVVEAGRKSGALITARWALDFGKEVFAVPGSPLMEQSAGCLELLSHGASMARDGSEILAALGLDALGKGQEIILEGLGLYGADLVTLAARTGLGSVSLSKELKALELTGRVRRLPGEYYLPVR